MTQEAQTSEDSQETGDATLSSATDRPEIVALRDYFLAQLVEWANRGIPLSVTLNLGGSLVTGTLASGKAWFEHATETLTGSGDSEVADMIKQMISPHAAAYEDGAATSPDWPNFIHLKNSRTFFGTDRGIPSQGPGVWWRGRLSEIKGFQFGELRVD